MNLQENWDKMSHEARELVYHADNTSQLAHTSKTPILKNLALKAKKGKYDHQKAHKLWQYHADSAAKSYHKEHGSRDQKWHHMFSTAHRKEAAAHWAEYHKPDKHGKMEESSILEHIQLDEISKELASRYARKADVSFTRHSNKHQLSNKHAKFSPHYKKMIQKDDVDKHIPKGKRADYNERKIVNRAKGIHLATTKYGVRESKQVNEGPRLKALGAAIRQNDTFHPVPVGLSAAAGAAGFAAHGMNPIAGAVTGAAAAVGMAAKSTYKTYRHNRNIQKDNKKGTYKHIWGAKGRPLLGEDGQPVTEGVRRALNILSKVGKGDKRRDAIASKSNSKRMGVIKHARKEGRQADHLEKYSKDISTNREKIAGHRDRAWNRIERHKTLFTRSQTKSGENPGYLGTKKRVNENYLEEMAMFRPDFRGHNTGEDDGKRYKVVRFHKSGNKGRVTIAKGLKLGQAQSHCQHPETSSSTAKERAGKRYTKNHGEWFDGYTHESVQLDELSVNKLADYRRKNALTRGDDKMHASARKSSNRWKYYGKAGDKMDKKMGPNESEQLQEFSASRVLKKIAKSVSGGSRRAAIHAKASAKFQGAHKAAFAAKKDYTRAKNDPFSKSTEQAADFKDAKGRASKAAGTAETARHRMVATQKNSKLRLGYMGSK
jgi:hypothetical protein